MQTRHEKKRAIEGKSRINNSLRNRQNNKFPESMTLKERTKAMLGDTEQHKKDVMASAEFKTKKIEQHENPHANTGLAELTDRYARDGYMGEKVDEETAHQYALEDKGYHYDRKKKRYTLQGYPKRTGEHL